jgi:hypothetical protein
MSLNVSAAYSQFQRNCQEALPAEVVLGSPKTKDCRNFGICRIRMNTTGLSKECRSVQAYLRIDLPTGRLLLHFVTGSLATPCAMRHFANNSFRIEEDFQIPMPVVKALALDGGYQSIFMEKGIYPTMQDANFYTVSIRLRRQARPTVSPRPMQRIGMVSTRTKLITPSCSVSFEPELR